MTDQEKIAEFLARKGATVVAAAPAFGVDPTVDRERRAANRARSYYADYTEQDAERHAERIREAYHVGGRRAAIDALNER